jgi:SAM-dependent methyltransferase
MNQRSLTSLSGILACPRCHKPLAIDSAHGVCECSDHGRYPFAGPFPSFVVGHDLAFEDHWDRNATRQLAPRKLELAQGFIKPLISRLPPGRPVTLLDAGCGEGAHVGALSAARSHRDDVMVGLDIAATALREAERRADDRWRFIHADMMELPFADASFDAVFSFGVLALTPQPQTATREMVRVLRPGGTLGLWVFLGGGALTRAALRALRGLARASGVRGATFIANALVPIYGFVGTQSGLSLADATWRQTREVLMSNLTPPYLHFLTETMLRKWLEDAGVAILATGASEPLTLWGEKR